MSGNAGHRPLRSGRASRDALYRVPPFNRIGWSITFSFLITGAAGFVAAVEFTVAWWAGLAGMAGWFAFAGLFFLTQYRDDPYLEVGADRLRLRDSRRKPWREYQRSQISSVMIRYNTLEILGVDGRRLDFLLVPRIIGPSPRVRRALESHGWLAEEPAPSG